MQNIKTLLFEAKSHCNLFFYSTCKPRTVEGKRMDSLELLVRTPQKTDWKPRIRSTITYFIYRPWWFYPVILSENESNYLKRKTTTKKNDNNTEKAKKKSWNKSFLVRFHMGESQCGGATCCSMWSGRKRCAAIRRMKTRVSETEIE